MNPLAILFFFGCAGALLAVERRHAPVPLLVGACYMTMGQGIHLGPFSLPVYRMLLATGLLRVLLRGETLAGPLNRVDKLMLAWAGWTFFASFFHNAEAGSGPIFTSGILFNLVLVYFLLRVWCRDLPEVLGVIRVVAVLLLPVALEMVFEKVTSKNLFAVFGGVPSTTLARAGRLRAQGPFRHPILAGTVGAACIPLFVALWSRDRVRMVIGIVAGLLMVLASASSGPVLSVIVGVGALLAWKVRGWTRVFRWGALAAYVLLAMVMSKPPYYLIGRIDLAGGSTGWHRSFLIDQTLHYFSEWWLFGTDYTRHWMPDQGIGSGNPNQTDITNYFISFAILGGLVSLGLVLGMLWTAFRWVGRCYRVELLRSPADAFPVWCLGAGLFAQVASGISVSYFDQSLVFFWLNVAVISSAFSAVRQTPAKLPPPPPDSPEAEPEPVPTSAGGHPDLHVYPW